MKLAPFQRLPFADLPEKPPIPHGFWQTEALDVPLDSATWGPMNVHVRRHGRGPPLLLIHGLNTTSYSWRYAFGPLGEHFTCYAPDLPANGRTDAAVSSSYAPQSLARWLIEVQRALDIYGCPVIGNSMGGYLAMWMVLEDPQCMSRLINEHSPGVPELRFYALNALLSLPGLEAYARWLFRRDPMRFVYEKLSYYDETFKSLEELREYGDPLATFDGQQGLVKYLGETMNPWAMRRFVARLEELSAFPVPLQLVYASIDPIVPPKTGDRLARLIPDAELVRLERGSHFAHVDALDAFLPPVLRFLGVG